MGVASFRWISGTSTLDGSRRSRCDAPPERGAAALWGQAAGFSPSSVRNAYEGKAAIVGHDRALAQIGELEEAYFEVRLA